MGFTVPYQIQKSNGKMIVLFMICYTIFRVMLPGYLESGSSGLPDQIFFQMH